LDNKNKIEQHIKFFKALSNSDRLEMIQLIKSNKEMYAQDVEKHFYMEQSTTSHHLNTLKRAGIAKSRKKGRNIYYSIDFEQFRKTWDEIEAIIFDQQ
jgi:DNA-binding transcriptional ArsR family regulator